MPQLSPTQVPATERGWVVITGCSSGIGLAVARALKDRGYAIVACCRLSTQQSALVAEFGQAVAFDLGDKDQVDQAINAIRRLTQDRIYALFNNAAYGQPGALEDIRRETLEAQFAANVFGPHQLTRGLLPCLLAQPSARLIQHSSLLGFVGMAYRGAYNASKYAVEGLSDTLRQELRGTSVHVSLIEPGPVLSEFRKNALAALIREVDIAHSRHSLAYQSSLERLAKPGPAAPFTLGPEAVIKVVIHALESQNPRIRYPVTTPAWVLGYLKRLLPARAFDWLIHKAGRA
jgi:NAD(P)-dependent dehydrogenase (short-subunit alcohol dehydrogenase family)